MSSRLLVTFDQHLTHYFESVALTYWVIVLEISKHWKHQKLFTSYDAPVKLWVNKMQKSILHQGRSQDLNQPLQNIVQIFNDDVIIMTLTSLLWHQRKTWKILSIVEYTGGLWGVLRFTAQLSFYISNL